MEFNTAGMYRAHIDNEETLQLKSTKINFWFKYCSFT